MMLPLMTSFHNDDGIIDLWTSEFLQDFDCRSKSTVDSESTKPHVAFGRTTHEAAEFNRLRLTRPHTVPILLPSYSNNGINNNRISFRQPTKLSDSRVQLTNEFLTRISWQQSKVRGSQMLNFKLDLSKAREKRKRQLQYSREIQSGSRTSHGREIDSVSRIVVQSFRKLIDCERCALFLMDDSTNELYFKPIDDIEHSHARLKEVRFPASSGVAGWVASNKTMLNIKNAYRDSRFNADIDKKTGFRTRTILCHPVLSSTNHLLGVIQMVNKKRSNPTELHDKAKKKGYQSNYEHFSEKDEEILGKCCSEVSKSLEDIFARQHRKRVEAKPLNEGGNFIANDSEKERISMSSCGEEAVADGTGDKPISPIVLCSDEDANSDARNVETVEQSSTTDLTHSTPELQRRVSTKRRSSIGDLSSFVNAIATSVNNTNDGEASSPAYGMGINEAIQKLHFRGLNSEILQQREMERRNCDNEYLLAQAKRDRMMEYGRQLHEPRNDESVDQSSTAESSTRSPEPQKRDFTRRRSSVSVRRRSSIGELLPSMNGSNSDGTADVEASCRGMGISEAIQKIQYRDQNSEMLKQREVERRNIDAQYLLARAKRNRMVEYSQQLREPRNDESVDQSSTADSSTRSPEPQRRDSRRRRSSVSVRWRSSIELSNLIEDDFSNQDACESDNAFHGMGISEAIQKLHYRDQNSEMLQQREAERRNSDAEYLLAQAKRDRMLKYSQQLRDPRSADSVDQSSIADISTLSPESQRRDSRRRRSSISERRRSSIDFNDLIQDDLSNPELNKVDNAFQGMGINEAIQKLHYRDQNSEVLQQREIERRNSDAEYLLAQAKRDRMLEYGQQLREPRNGESVEHSSSTADISTPSPVPQLPQRRLSARRRSSVGERRRSSIGDLVGQLLQGSLTSPDVRAVDNAFQGMGISEAVQKLHYRDNNSEMLQQREAERRNSDAEYLLALSKRERMLEYGQQIKERRRSSDGEFQCNLMEKI